MFKQIRVLFLPIDYVQTRARILLTRIGLTKSMELFWIISLDLLNYSSPKALKGTKQILFCIQNGVRKYFNDPELSKRITELCQSY
jgi:hypothetical protein